MADELVLFQAGQKITAEETNDNNRYLLGVAQDTSGELQNYINTQLAGFQNTLNTQISSINAQIAAKANTKNPTLTGTVKVPNSATVGTAISTAAISKGGNGYLKLGNGIILQWVAIYDDPNRTKYGNFYQTFPTPFTDNTYALVCGSSYKQTAGDKGATIQLWRNGTTNFGYSIRYEQSRGSTTWVFAIGY